MATFGHILLIAMPIFLILVLCEEWYGYRYSDNPIRSMDTISSLMSGTANVTKSVLGLSVAIISYSWLVEHLAIIHVKSTVLTYLIAFIALDFSGYWIHRIQHTYNFFWNNHMIHHSSEEFNLACALRQTIAGFVKLFTFFLLPAALLGVSVEVIAITAPLHLFIQFWYHTEHIGKLGVLEHIIVTPSHHRVHHAINPIYIDKNLSQVFIVWDKIFGTFQEELPEEPPVYGVTRPVRTWNPIKINFLHFWNLIQDAWHTKNWWDKCRIWLMPTGWRPPDVVEKYPIKKIRDIYHFEKYRTATSPTFTAWCWLQLAAILGFIVYFFSNIAFINALNSSYIYLYGLFIFIAVYALTDLMDRNRSALIAESLKATLGITLLLWQQDWFGATAYSTYSVWIVGTYLLLSLAVTAYFVIRHSREDAHKAQKASEPTYIS